MDLKDRQLRRKGLAVEFSKTMQCNCDLDRWEPEKHTGHSHVCDIHKAVMEREHNDQYPVSSRRIYKVNQEGS